MKVNELNIHNDALSTYFTLEENLDLKKLPFLLQVLKHDQEQVCQVQVTRLPFHFNTRSLGIGDFHFKIFDIRMQLIQEGMIRVP